MTQVDAILKRLLALHPRRIDLSLGRMWRILEALGHPQRRLPPTIHVAGTNGKGSTVAFMRAMLEAAGKSVHAYTSPNLVRINERFRLAGTLVGDDELAEVLADCERANGSAPITVFEIETAAAFDDFRGTVDEDDLLNQLFAALVEIGFGLRTTTATRTATASAAITTLAALLLLLLLLGTTLRRRLLFSATC